MRLLKYIFCFLFFQIASVSFAQRSEPNLSIKAIDTTPLALILDSDQAYCSYLADRGRRNYFEGYPEYSRRAYDTLKLLIESCPNSITPSLGATWHAFGEIGTSVQDMSNDNNRWLELKDWLKKVLYLNTDTLYYCADANEMFYTFNYIVPGKGQDVNGIISLIDYLLTTNHCPELKKDLTDTRIYLRTRQIQKWQDTVKDSVSTPLDTTELSIDDLGLSILRGPEFGAVRPTTIREGAALGELRANRNPFSDETTLQFHLDDALMLKIEVIDLLGNTLYAETRFFNSGEAGWTLNGKTLPQGSLYARVSSIGGAVRTIKLIKE